MSGKVIFYSLTQKFLDRQEDMPAEAKQVVYYSLAIGHHVGVIDCLKPVLECPLEDFEGWIGKLVEGEARSKLEGILKWGEINIDSSHIHMLASALDSIRTQLSSAETAWTEQLIQAFKAIEVEPAIYLIVKRC
ncbi:MAG: formate hydrogenlyase maturation HycH family protein [Formivibrio sp.]|nr:formate hydrogenlyase maturation HycH family protein [Formivibrio sp.]